jgi:transcription-repair coupling factor
MEALGLTLMVGQKISNRKLAKRLVGLGYENVAFSTPTKEGQFGGRGNLIDLWLERYKNPVRVDLIGEKIESIYLFNYLTQQKIKKLKEIYIVPRGTTPKLAPKWAKKAKFPSGSGRVERLFLSEIQPGDLVVHIDYGIGRFLSFVGAGDREFGLSTVAFQTRSPAKPGPPRPLVDFEGTPEVFEGAGLAQTSEKPTSSQNLTPSTTEVADASLAASAGQFLVVEYARGDKLYVPVEQIERLTKYIGAPGYKPRLNTLGTSGWERVKQRVQESIIKVAKDLLSLYARREVAKRAPYSADTPWQKALEDSFEFPETADQIKATEEIKRDLESNRPMDRILVGDVGFGKTEVAIRAAFKVVQEGKQVAVLVPTTILAQQHYHLFKERLGNFPVSVEMLSRFRGEEQQRGIVEKLKSGTVDIVIGTHRLLSADVGFKSLGLLIIDEEHRFGVQHKEKLKKLRTSVDVLSMSATPIPRSLHMALTDLRDISVLQEPPLGRKPIATFVGEYDQEKIKKALSKEIERNGQSYYLFNNISLIDRKAAEVSSLVPAAKVVFAHGQMDKQNQKSKIKSKNLEEVMDEFYSGKADILVCTTIIGSGLDMPNVNTIIIENAQRFGLADLHQLRGRVGRSERQAYCYLFYPKGYVPAGNVLERLSTIASSTELGAGFEIAKRDLEIRGAGNLLGVAQSGNIALVGFELYIQLLSQEVERLKKGEGYGGRKKSVN